MLHRLPIMPKRNKINHNWPILPALLINNNSKIYSTMPLSNMVLLPYLAIIQPQSGRLINEPAGKANKTPPNAPLLK